MVDWSKLPDLGAVAFLACAFASVSRRSRMPVSGIWLTGWVMIILHFAASMLVPIPGIWGTIAAIFAVASLTWSGILFMWASVPYRKDPSSRWMLTALLEINTLYIAIVRMDPDATWPLILTAILYGAVPLGFALFALPRSNHPMRWALTILYSALSIFLLVFQHHPGNGAYLAQQAVLFSVFFGCSMHFFYVYRRSTTGAFITIAGFFSWAGVFVLAPAIDAFLPSFHLQDEAWNLPKYVVAVGMILLLLENQIEHNKYLALHDELTKLPNRRLFQDRLAIALERARRTGSQTALLLVDLNHFKQVNDTLGHHVGDLLLKQVSEIFSGRVRRSDTVARTGGDEFSIILEEPTCREEAEQVGCSLMELLETPLQLAGQTVRAGASIGIAIYPEDAATMESLCIVADLRMYAEKQSSRNSRPQEQPRPRLVSAFPQVDTHAGLQLVK